MRHQSVTIKEALDNIATNDYVLPAIQREFVWKQAQICMLFDSVMQRYSFGMFLFWKIEPKNSANYRYYGFVREYHQRDNAHCPDLGQLPNRPIRAVLDGQQRLTAFNIGLRGAMAVKLPYKWWNNPGAFPRTVLALDLLFEAERDEDGKKYRFEFVDDTKAGHDNGSLWFKVPDILAMSSGPDMHDWLLDFDLTKKQQKRAYRTLDLLYRVVHDQSTIVYYEETNQDIEHVLNIFIRTNSGGTTLSYSDLLLSIATSQWTRKDARKEVHRLVDDLNRIGPGLGLSKDFVLKAGLMLSDIASVGFQVRNFTADNMKILEENWGKIRNALFETVQIITGFGFDAKSIRAVSALLPIAYYIYKLDSPSDFESSRRFDNDRNAIRGWLTRSILKASGIWGSGLDTFLTGLRKTIREADMHFPAARLRRLMDRRGKGLDFSEEEIDDLATMEFNDRRVFSLLALLTPFLDLKHNTFHIDHVFPKSRFTARRLRCAGVQDEQIDKFRDSFNRIANLQLLEGLANLSKRAKLPAEWMVEEFPEKASRENYCERYILGDIPDDIVGFLDFYNERRARLRDRIAELVNSV